MDGNNVVPLTLKFYYSVFFGVGIYRDVFYLTFFQCRFCPCRFYQLPLTAYSLRNTKKCQEFEDKISKNIFKILLSVFKYSKNQISE